MAQLLSTQDREEVPSGSPNRTRVIKVSAGSESVLLFKLKAKFPLIALKQFLFPTSWICSSENFFFSSNFAFLPTPSCPGSNSLLCEFLPFS